MMFKCFSHPFSNTAAVTVALLAAVRQQVGASVLTPHIFTHVRSVGCDRVTKTRKAAGYRVNTDFLFILSLW